MRSHTKVQCSHCLLYWNQGIVYFTCGQCLIDSESKRKFNKLRLDTLSIPNYVIKKRPTHGARHGKTEVQREYHMAWNAWKRCYKKVDSRRSWRRALVVLGSPLGSSCVELAAQMNPTPCHTMMTVLCCTTSLLLFEDMPRHYHGEAIFSLT